MTDEPASHLTDDFDVLASPQHRAGPFDRFAEATSKFVSRSSFFTVAVILTIVWVPTIRRHAERLRASVKLERKI